MRTKGKIISWNDDKGFGFVAPSTGGKEIFIHIKAFNNRNRRPIVNQLVTYVLSSDKQGRPCAKDATLLSNTRFSQRKISLSMSIIGALIFFLIVGISVVLFKLPPLVFILYLVVSLVTYIIYAIDKSAAKRGSWRTKENTLHLFSLIGGWPGAMIAQQHLRHKSKKHSFRSIYFVTVFVNLCAFIWLFTPTGTNKLPSLFSINDTYQISSSLSESKIPNFLINAGDALKSFYEGQITDKNVQVYKWQDENGSWHFSENAPTLNEKVTNIKTLKVNTDTNMIPSSKMN